jgi:UDP-glucose 4-epimerase
LSTPLMADAIAKASVMKQPTTLLTGGTGYIGAHTAVELMSAGHHVVLLDNLSNSSVEVLPQLERLCGKHFTFVQADIRNKEALDSLFQHHQIDSVIHFAGLKVVSESVSRPLDYFDNNVGGTIALLRSMEKAGVRRIVFSSSANVYGNPERVPVTEDSRLGATNPYGHTKLVCEDLLRDLQRSDPAWKVAILRYFNPVGAHESGWIGERPNGTPNNLMPYIALVASGELPHLRIFGSDYPTPDGTGVRDYIHVMDLAQGHLAALKYLQEQGTSITVNLGTGRGTSVKELADAFAHVNKVPIPCVFAERRPGDIASSYADTTLANRLLGWRARFGVEQMCADAWRWQLNQYVTDVSHRPEK